MKNLEIANTIIEKQAKNEFDYKNLIPREYFYINIKNIEKNIDYIFFNYQEKKFNAWILRLRRILLAEMLFYYKFEDRLESADEYLKFDDEYHDEFDLPYMDPDESRHCFDIKKNINLVRIAELFPNKKIPLKINLILNYAIEKGKDEFQFTSDGRRMALDYLCPPNSVLIFRHDNVAFGFWVYNDEMTMDEWPIIILTGSGGTVIADNLDEFLNLIFLGYGEYFEGWKYGEDPYEDEIYKPTAWVMGLFEKMTKEFGVIILEFKSYEQVKKQMDFAKKNHPDFDKWFELIEEGYTSIRWKIKTKIESKVMFYKKYSVLS